MTDRRMLDTDATARYLGLAPHTLAKRRMSGDGPPFTRIGRRVLYDKSELDRWCDERPRYTSTGPSDDAE